MLTWSEIFDVMLIRFKFIKNVQHQQTYICIKIECTELVQWVSLQKHQQTHANF